MANRLEHSIKNQILDIRHGRHINTYARQSEISARYQNEVIPLLEKICDELCPGDDIIKIDTLIIELPAMTERSYKATWANEVEKAFRKSLSEVITKAGSSPQNNATVLNKAEADLQLIRYFLYTGAMPWSYNENQKQSLESIFRELIKQEAAAVHRLLKEGLKQEAFTKRLCYQFPEPLVIELFSLLQPAHATDIINYYQSLKEGFKASAAFKNRSGAVFLLRYYILWQLAQPYRDEKHFIEEVLRSLSHIWNIPYEPFLDTLKAEAIQHQMSYLFDVLEALYSQISQSRPQELPPETEPESSGKSYERLKTFLRTIEAITFQEAPEVDGIYLQNAGLVIVCPFLKELFEALQLTEKHQFADEAKQHRAIHLLQYLVSGETCCEEYRLGLNKFLCGLALHEPIPQQIILSEKEKESAEDLIKAAIGHWPMMKNTSVEGFRQAFLLREGKLSQNSDGWLLQVEQKGYDLIMDKLPWGFSLVKLPWMPEPLFVEW